jgi:inner membrane transporter RhtA
MDPVPALTRASPATGKALSDRLPPHAFFIVSAVFHYLGPAFAVLLFARLEPLGVAWLRIATAALVFAAWRRPCATSAVSPAAIAAASRRWASCSR